MHPRPEPRRFQFATRCRQLWARLEPVRARVRTRFEVDTRSLAALRIALGLIILIDLIHRASYLELFYTDAGAYPLAGYEATYTRYDGLSIHALSGELWAQQLLFALAGLFALALILGYRTRFVALVSFLLLFSLHARNPAVLNGGDRLLRVLLFVALWTPLGERWSIDALRRDSAQRTVVGFTTAALLVQPVVVFSSNAILKHQGTTWYAGEAVGIALANDVMTVGLGNHLVEYPALLTALNFAWVTLLVGSSVFLLATTGRLRAVFVFAYVGAFAGMLASMAIGLFPLVLTASVLAFLTAPFWDTVARLLPSHVTDRFPRGERVASFVGPPVERRLLADLRERGHGSIASFLAEFGRALLTVVGVLVLAWILVFSASYVTGYDVPKGIDDAHLDQQRWGLYAPNPSTSYSWYVVEAELESGERVDAFEEGEVDWDRPPDPAREYDTFRHRKFMETVRSSSTVAGGYADWACGRADAVHDEEVEQVTVYRIVQPSPVDGEYEDPDRRTVITRAC